tara:strand:+ start:710 stop:880 length:171 start_codon:yes stop_codon:yes gene_type:complete
MIFVIGFYLLLGIYIEVFLAWINNSGSDFIDRFELTKNKTKHKKALSLNDSMQLES